jgi:hypothetical protein
VAWQGLAPDPRVRDDWLGFVTAGDMAVGGLGCRIWASWGIDSALLYVMGGETRDGVGYAAGVDLDFNVLCIIAVAT